MVYMKKLLKNSVFRILITVVGDICLFVFLFTYIIPYNLTNVYSIVITILLFIFFALVFTITMLCDMCFDESSKQLVIHADLEKAFKWIKAMRKIDLFRWYQYQYYVFLTIYYRDKDELIELQSILDNQVFKKNKHMKIIYHYNKFILAIHECNQSIAEEEYTQIKKIYENESSKRTDRIALVYSLDMIKAEYNYFLGNFKNARQNISDVAKSKLNTRELAHYYYLYYKILLMSNKKADALKEFHNAKTMYPQGLFIKPLDKIQKFN